MDDQMPADLPRYVFRRANGSFRYKRNVPLKLRALIGKDTLYRRLGDSYREAMQNLPLVHARVEALFAGEAEKSARMRSLELIRGALGDEVVDLVLAGAVPEYSDTEDELNELGKELHRKNLPIEVVQQVYSGKLVEDAITLASALDEYVAFKSDTPKATREITQRINRLKADMAAVFGKTKLTKVPLEEITRQDANDLRDHLMQRVSANSAARMLGVVRTAINHVIVEHSLVIPNVFTKLKIKGAGATKNDRLPLTDEQVTLLEPAFSHDPNTWALFATLRDTGARLSEIAGLRVADCDVEQRCIHIAPNSWRSLKTTTSERSVPLSDAALAALKAVARGKDAQGPLFPAYARARGGDAASAMLMKRFRKVITDKKLTTHSLRHRMKDKLRNTGCPETLSMAILGHSQNTVAANYGSGYALEVIREAMEKVWTTTIHTRR
jgi:integrase